MERGVRAQGVELEPEPAPGCNAGDRRRGGLLGLANEVERAVLLGVEREQARELLGVQLPAARRFPDDVG
eukprot:12487033-Alexandrium_andersonii.AAC.1